MNTLPSTPQEAKATAVSKVYWHSLTLHAWESYCRDFTLQDFACQVFEVGPLVRAVQKGRADAIVCLLQIENATKDDLVQGAGCLMDGS